MLVPGRTRSTKVGVGVTIAGTLLIALALIPAPSLAAQAVQLAKNANKVDGFSAVPCDASQAKLLNTLVATCPVTGLLPAAVIPPVTAPNSNMLGGQPPSAFLPADQFVETGLISTSAGSSQELATVNNVTFGSNCINDGGGTIRQQIQVSSTLPGAIAASPYGFLDLTPTPVSLLFVTSNSGYALSDVFRVVDGNGLDLQVAAFYAVKKLGSDCVASLRIEK